MIKCPECGFENPEGLKYCENCGAELPQVAVAEEEESVGEKIKCPHCGNLNDPNNKVCFVCGMPLGAEQKPAEPVTEPEQPPAEAEAPKPTVTPAPPPAAILGKVKLVVEQGMVIGKQFLLNDPEILIGRLDEEDNIFPDIDLTDQDEGYVSRSHAKIEIKEDKMFITHLSKTNPTLLNKKPIPENTPTEFKVGDTIKVGKVVLRVQEV